LKLFYAWFFEVLAAGSDLDVCYFYGLIGFQILPAFFIDHRAAPALAFSTHAGTGN
jgi:hypothetical protein